jgi:hypothetical protein
VRDRLKVSQSSPYVYFRYTPCLTDFTFKFIRRPISPILSPSSRTFVELTLVTRKTRTGSHHRKQGHKLKAPHSSGLQHMREREHRPKEGESRPHQMQEKVEMQHRASNTWPLMKLGMEMSNYHSEG